MLTSIGRQPALARLTTRADDDSTIALTDAWAASLDVLAFYQERYANENYLRTATERRSILELGRMIGYELRPGVAASTTLAYALQDTPGSPTSVKIAAGSQAMTTPGQDETAQTFETSQDLDAHVAWNALAPASWAVRIPQSGDTSIRLSGAALNINPGDMLLIVGDERLHDPGSPIIAIRRAVTVRAVPATPATTATQTNPSTPGNPAYSDIALNKPLDACTPRLNPKIYVLRQSANLFGTAALDWNSLPTSTQQAYEGQAGLTEPIYEWPNFTICGVSERAPAGSSLPSCDGTGFYGEYYTDAFQTRYGGMREAKIDFGPGNPFGIALPPPFRVRWSARVVLPNDGTFVFTVTANGYVRLIVDGQIVIDHGNGGTKAVPNLKANRKHSIVLEYATGVGAPAVTLSATATGFESGDHGTINLDRTLAAASVGQWVVITAKQDAFAYQVTNVAEDGLSAFATMAHSARLDLSGSGLVDRFDSAIRSASIFAVSEVLEFGQYPVMAPLSGATIALAAGVPDLPVGRKLVIAGTNPVSGAQQCEVAAIKSVASDGMTIGLVKPLTNDYAISGTTIYGNCVDATHGATIPRPEVLGAGDGSRRFQSFALKQKPLTYVSAASASGVSTTLDVKVNDVSWSEVPSLLGQPASARVFTTRDSDDGTVRIMFGNGNTGARLPTGVENIVANYRTGVGMAGMAKANQINIALTRPLGVSTVTNPAAPTGAQDPESLAGGRVNAPLTVLTLDRVVSVSDYADFARDFAGIGKAVAALVWSGQRRIVFITVASASGSSLPSDATAYTNLIAAIDNLAPADHHFRVADYIPRPFKMKAAIVPETGLDFAEAEARVQAAMAAKFSFASRELGEALAVSEVVAAIQGVEGVLAARLDMLEFVTADAVNTRPNGLLAGASELPDGTILPAGLILLAPNGLELVEMAP